MSELMKKIKKAASDNGTKIQSPEAAKLEKILNKLFYLEKNINEEVKFIKSVMTRGRESQERVGLHASSFIANSKDFCVRQQVLSLVYRQLQGEQVNVGLKRIFEEGNAIHEKWQRLLIRGGYCTHKDLDVTQFNKEYRISFTPDIICKIPEFYDGLMIGEIKSVNTFQFGKMVKEGKNHPSAYKQLQFYMYLTGIHKGFVLCEDKNTQDFRIEVYDYDESIIADCIDRAEEVKYRYEKLINDKKLIKRPTDAKSPTCKRCDKCAMKLSCWKLPGGLEKINK